MCGAEAEKGKMRETGMIGNHDFWYEVLSAPFGRYAI
jgi:hypothetical protein